MKTTIFVQKHFWFERLLIGSFLFVISFASNASPNLITFQSRLIKPNGQPLEAASVNFRFSLTDALGTCVIFQEDFTNRSMVDSKGLISLTLGGGSKVYPAGPMTLAEVFNNYNFPNFNCQAGGSVSAGSTDRRRLVMQFNDGSGWQTVPAMDINANPFALQALSAQKLGEYPAADYLRTAALPSCGPTQALNFNGASITCVAAGGAGAGTVTSVTSVNADIGITNTTTTPQLTLNTGTGNDQIVKLNGSAQLPAVSGVNLTLLNATNLGSGTVPDARMPALTGDVTTVAGAVATSIAANAVTSGKIIDDTIVNADINASAGIARSKLAAGTLGQVVMNDATTGLPISIGCANGEVIKFNGSGVAVCGTDTTGTSGFVDGGNTFTGTATIGTNSNHNLEIETNGSTKMTVLANGNVGVGTATPTAPLDVMTTNTQNAIGSAAALNTTMNYAPTAANSAITYGISATSTYAPAGTAHTNGGPVGGTFSGESSSSGTSNLSVIYGSYSRANHKSSSVAQLVVGADNAAQSTNSGGAITTAHGTQSGVQATASIITTAYGMKSNVVTSASASSFIVQGYGGHFGVTRGAGSTITNAYGIYTGNVQGTNAWSLYASDATAPSYFAGNVGVGTASPLRLLHVNGPMKITPTTVPAAPAAGDMYVDSADGNKLKIYDGGVWVASGGGGSVTNVSSANADIGVVNAGTTPVLTLNAATTGADKILRLNATGGFDAISGANLTALNASNLGSGTVPAARMPALTGEVTTVAGAVATTIAANAVTSAKILDDEIIDADIKTTAAIARTKLANGSNDHVLINTGAGVMSSEAQLAISRGGTGLASYTNNALIMANGTGTALTNATCSIGEILMWNATTWACTNMAASTQGYFKDGGNTFTGTATIGTNSNHNLEIETNGTTKMTVLANGNVGIGTTSPGTALTIVNDGGVSTKDTVQIISYGAATTPMYSIIKARGTAAAPTSVLAGDTTSSFQSAAWDGSALQQAIAIATNIETNFSTSPKAAMVMYTNGGSGITEKMRITSSGNVGIGTTAPSYKMDVRSNSTNVVASIGFGTGNLGVLGAMSARGTIAAPTASQAGDMIGVVGSSGYGTTGFSSGLRGYMVTYAAENWTDSAQGTHLTFATTPIGTAAPVERIAVGSDGNVGVGTTSPSEKLQVTSVDATAYVSTSSSRSAPATTASFSIDNSPTSGAGNNGATSLLLFKILNGSSSLEKAYIAGVSTGGLGGGPALVFGRNTDSAEYAESMRISPGGDVGIGNTGPSYPLDVTGSIRTTRAILNSSAVPTMSVCGTAPPAATTGSNNNTGQFTLGTGATAACTVTFANAFPTNAFCTVTPASNYTGTYYISAQSNTAFTVTLGTGTASVKFNYTCGGN